MKIGYARVSTQEQNLDLQIDALKMAGCEKVFTDKISGVKEERPGLQQALLFARNGDSIVVWKLDRLGRSLSQLISLVNALNDKGVAFVSLNESIETTSAGGKLIFHIFSALAEFERDLIKSRTQSGLLAARARGKIGGRPEKLSKKQISAMSKLSKVNDLSIKDICSQFQISRSTYYRLSKNKHFAQHE